MPQPADSYTPPSNARRKLIRGAFSAPAIMTVCSGSAFAAASSLRCIANQNADPTFLPVSNGTDSYLRVQLYQLTRVNKTTRYFVAGSDVVNFKRDGNSVYLTQSQWHEFAIGTNKTVGTPTTTTPSGTGYTLGRANKWAVLRIDAQGNVVGVGIGDGGSAIAGTCWNSFAMIP